MTATEVLERRLQEFHARIAVRHWEYRQRHHAKGVWFRLRRLLALSAECWLIDAAQAARLEMEGLQPEPGGAELEPPRRLYVVSAARLARIEGRRQIRVALSAELLGAQAVALVPFGEVVSPGSRRG